MCHANVKLERILNANLNRHQIIVIIVVIINVDVVFVIHVVFGTVSFVIIVGFILIILISTIVVFTLNLKILKKLNFSFFKIGFLSFSNLLVVVGLLLLCATIAAHNKRSNPEQIRNTQRPETYGVLGPRAQVTLLEESRQGRVQPEELDGELAW